MRYVSPEGRLAGPEAAFDNVLNRRALVWDRARRSLGGGRFWSVLLVLLLTFTVARSTSTVQWVGGIEVVNVIALLAAVLMSVLALSPIRDWIGLGIARKGWLEPSGVLNTRDADGFLAFARQRRTLAA